MRKFLFFTILFSLTPAHARQYIQCSTLTDETDAAVIHLQTEDHGTFYLVSGSENDEERVLVEIRLQKIERGQHVYEIVNEPGQGTITIPSATIGQASDDLMIDLAFDRYLYHFSCFSRIYLD